MGNIDPVSLLYLRAMLLLVCDFCMRDLSQVLEEVEEAYTSTDVLLVREFADELQPYSDLRAIAWRDLCLGYCDIRDGDFIGSLKYSSRAHQVFSNLDDKKMVGYSLMSIGTSHYRCGDYVVSQRKNMEAAKIFQVIKHQVGLANANVNIANILQDTGQEEEAFERFESSHLIMKSLGNDVAAAVILDNMGRCQGILGNLGEACDLLKKATIVLTEFDCYDLAEATELNLVHGLIRAGRIEEARSMLKNRRESEYVDPLREAGYLWAKSRIAKSDGDIETAKMDSESSLAICKLHNFKAQIALNHKELRKLAHQCEDFAGYIEHNEAYLKIREDIRGDAQQRLLAIQEKDREIEAERAERERERAILHSTLPKHVADRIVRGEDVADYIEEASVMFVDIVGFTQFSARSAPDKVVNLLRTIFSECDRVCLNHGLTKIKTIGDSYLAVCGVPEQVPDHANWTARAALEIVVNLKEIEEFEVNRIEVRVGVHCGSLVAGVVGDERIQYDVWGDTVNVASRMESSGSPGRVQVSEDFVKKLDQDKMPFIATPRQIEIKGLGKVTTYWLEGAD
jgi:class 3 adenylate cyclase